MVVTRGTKGENASTPKRDLLVARRGLRLLSRECRRPKARHLRAKRENRKAKEIGAGERVERVSDLRAADSSGS